MVLEKKKYKKPVIIIVVIILAYFLFFKKDVSVSDVEWDCNLVKDKWKCDVSYLLINESHDWVKYNVSVRGQRDVTGGRSTSIEKVGEETFIYELHPKQRLQISETLFLNRRPSLFQVNAWE